MLKIQIIIGSTREGRKSEMVAKWIYSIASKREDVTFELVDLRDWELPYYNQKEGGPRMVDDQMSLEKANHWRDKVSEADGYIIVTPEYNHGYPAVLKNALDYTYKPWNKKPLGLVSYGSLGGGRVVEQLKTVAVELQLAPMQHAVNLMKVRELFDESGKMLVSDYDDSVNLLLDQLIWWAQALKTAREKSN